MPIIRIFIFLLLLSLPTLTGCGGGGENATSSTSPANTTAGIKIYPATTITTDESGLAATIWVSLGTKPTADVTIPINSSDTTEGTVDKTNLIFTSANWSTAQSITVIGIDDSNNDGDQNYTIHLGAANSTDSTYRAMELTISAINLDMRKGTIVVSPISNNTSESGTTATFTVRLSTAPTADVTIPVQSSDLTEGTVDKNSLTFTAANWDKDQTVTITGVPDPITGDDNYSILLGPATSSDTAYNNQDPADVSLTNLNAKIGFVDVTAISDTATDESGKKVTFQVQLQSQPASEVTIPVQSSNPAEGTVDKSNLTFTTANWAMPQTVTVTGIDDPNPDGDQKYSILLGLTASADDNYNGLDPADISLINKNVKTGSFTVTAISANTDETGKSGTFKVRLNSKPAANVTIPVTSSDLSEGKVDKASLVFTDSNWDQDQTITVTGVSDLLADGDISYRIQLGNTTSNDDNYNGINPPDVDVTNLDVRTPSLEITAISGKTDESGLQATFQVRLGSQPTADVTIPVSSSDTTEGTVDKTSLLFTDTNWDQYQTVTVTGVTDSIGDGDQTYSILLAPALSSDSLYNGLDPADVTVINVEVKTGAIIVSGISGNTDESGKQASFQVSLASQPSADVTIAISSSNPAEGTASPTTLTFTNADWAPKTVTVTGVDDAIADGNQDYWIVLGAASSSDYNYSGMFPLPSTLSVTNVDLVDPYGVEPRISAGAYHNLVLASDGTVWGWGTCADGQLDAMSTTCASTFVLPQRLNITGAAAVAAGHSFSVIAKTDGTVWTSGNNSNGQLGHASGTKLAQVSGVNGVGLLTGIAKVAAGTYHVLALTNSGSVLAWGNGFSGQLGNSFVGANSQTPVPTTGAIVGKTITAIAAGGWHSLALDATGLVYAWGSDGNEQLGLGNLDQSTATPTQINATTQLNTVSAIAAGQSYSFAVGRYGATTDTFGWGSNSNMQLGTSSGDKQIPTGLNTFSSSLVPNRLDGGISHSLALVGSDVYVWGKGTDNALGLGSTLDIGSPTLAPLWGTAVDVNAGANYSLGLLTDGRLKSSGMNDAAQLGTNEVDPGLGKYTSTPVYVEDPGDGGNGTSTYFYAYRPILSGQPATTTTSTTASITVCSNTLVAPANCGPITHFRYSTNSGVTWSAATPIATPISLPALTVGTVNLWVKGMSSISNEIQSDASAVKVSWTVVAP
jgi:alpha-tubulin suppressor-like RCC1 family protein